MYTANTHKEMSTRITLLMDNMYINSNTLGSGSLSSLTGQETLEEYTQPQSWQTRADLTSREKGRQKLTS